MIRKKMIYLNKVENQKVLSLQFQFFFVVLKYFSSSTLTVLDSSVLKLYFSNNSSVLALKGQGLFFLSICDIFFTSLAVFFTKHISHFCCVSLSIWLLCWFSIQWPVFSCRTLGCSFSCGFLKLQKLMF